MYRLAILNSHPVQYAVPFYRRLAREPELDFTVYFYSRQGADEYVDADFGRAVRWDVPLLEGYRYKFLPNLRRHDRVAGFASLVNPAILAELRRERYDAVFMNGYSFLTDWFAFFAARSSGTPILYGSDASLIYDREVRRPWYIRWFKPLMLRWIFGAMSSFLASGSLSRQFYEFYGAPPERIFLFPAAVDNEHFASRGADFGERRNALRMELGIAPEDVVFVFAAKMTPVKAPLELLQAYEKATRDSVQGTALLMVGDGPLRAEAECFARERKLKKVVFTGFANQGELPKYYAMSDVFVRPDGVYKGPWGYTVNEAMCCGLAVIVTDKIGATYDLVRHGANGLVVKFRDLDALAAAMRQLAADPEGTRQMGRRSAELIRTWSYEQCVEGLFAALRSLDSNHARCGRAHEASH